MANGFNVSNWHWVNATVPNVAALEKVDIVMSLLSWGFHYPIEVYSSTVRQLLKPGGRLILTIRAGKGLELKLERAGFSCEVLPSQPKSFGAKALLIVCK